jgi:hypothetical protein
MNDLAEVVRGLLVRVTRLEDWAVRQSGGADCELPAGRAAPVVEQLVALEARLAEAQRTLAACLADIRGPRTLKPLLKVEHALFECVNAVRPFADAFPHFPAVQQGNQVLEPEHAASMNGTPVTTQAPEHAA